MRVEVLASALIGIVLINAILVPIIVDSTPTDDDVLDVLIIDGQSNAAYWDVCDPIIVNQDYSKVPVHNLYYYGTSVEPIQFRDNQGNVIYDPTFKSYNIYEIYQNGSYHIGGYEPILANELSIRSGHDTLIINIGIGGESISTLEPGSGGGIFGFDAINDALKKAESRYDSFNMLGWVWSQGEADKNLSVLNYKMGFDKLYRAFENIGAKKCYVIETRPEYGGNSCIALNEIIGSYPNVLLGTNIALSFTENDGTLVSGDPLHYSQKGRDVIATILGDEIDVSYTSESSIVYDLIQIIPILVGVALLIAIGRAIFKQRN